MRRFIASGLGLGLIPRRLWGSDNGAGTFGAALGGIVGIVSWVSTWWLGLALAVAAIAVSVWASAPQAHSGEDPGWVVIDEVAGALVAVIGLSGVAWVVAWIVARIADITKTPPGVKQAESLPAPWGITADDVVAGLYGLAAGVVVAVLI